MANALADRGPTNTQTVAAVVVTYNRKNLLKQCLEAILAQTRPVDRIVVVDNCSTDGTPEFLEAEGFLQEPVVEYVRLAENMGGAGGFHEGMKRAYEQGYDWLWVMDDDGVAQPNALEKLLGCPPGILFRGCLVVNNEDPAGEELAFGLVTSSGDVQSVSEALESGNSFGVVEGYANPFNGVLVSREVVRRIGLPRKELFIWGDEREYLHRAKRSGIPIGAVVGARHFHPANRKPFKRIRMGAMSFSLPYSDDPLRFYLIVRNNAYIAFRYQGPFTRPFLKHLAYPLFFPRRAAIASMALLDGVIGRFPSIRKLKKMAVM